MAIAVTLTTTPKSRPDESDLGFGRFFSDHMFVMDWEASRGWFDPRIVPYGPFSLDPAAGVLHYGQAMFEGLKAFKRTDGTHALFRPQRHAERMAYGAPRLCMPAPDNDMFIEGAKALVRADRDWVPSPEGTALYLRPTLIATEAFLGVRPSSRYIFFIIASPVGSYYGGGLRPVKIWVERDQTRAAKGGLGAVKAGANYVASLDAAVRAKKAGYDQVLWLDGAKHEVTEEVGTMNFFALIGDELVTPPLSDSILAGVTRDSVITLATDRGLRHVERPLMLAELVDAARSGQLKEAFGSGSAAVVSPIAELAIGDERLVIGGGETGPVARSLYEEIIGIQRGTRPDKHGWLSPV
jgi:branched-chain amino acid aminotransferase